MFDVMGLREVGQKLAGADPADRDDDTLLADAVGLEQLRSLVELATARHAAELERRQLTDRDQGLRTGLWLARETGAAPTATKTRCGSVSCCATGSRASRSPLRRASCPGITSRR